MCKGKIVEYMRSVLVKLDKGTFTQSVFLAIANFEGLWKVKEKPTYMYTHMYPWQTYK